MPIVVRHFRRFAPMILIAVALAIVLTSGVHHYVSLQTLAEHHDWLRGQVETHAVLSVAVFIGVYTAAVALSIPGAVVLTVTGGFLFGPVAGSVLTVTGATLGAVALFFAARTAAGPWLRERTGARLARFVDGFRKDAFSYILTLRLVPVFPFWLVNLAPALLGVRLRTFTAATLLGIIPGSVVYASLGNGVGEVLAAGRTPDLGILANPSVIGPLLALAGLSLVPAIVRRCRASRRPPEKTEAA